MGKKLSISETERAQIVVSSKEGYSEREVSAKTAVHTTIANFNYGSYKDLNKSWRPIKTYPEIIC